MNQNQEKISLKTLLDKVPGKGETLECIGLTGADKAYAVSRLYDVRRHPMVIVLSSPKAAKQFMEDLKFFMNGEAGRAIKYFPPYNLLPIKFLASHNETAATRIRTLYRIVQREMPPVIVTTTGAVMKKIIPKQRLVDFAELILAGEEVDRDDLVKKLVSGGYVSTAIVEEPGDFCTRGGILDIFSPLYKDPFRIELFGDFVESIRFFSAATQRTRENINEAIILPSKEVVLADEDIGEVIARVREQGARLDLPVTEVRKMVERIRNEGVFSGIESLIGLIYSRMASLPEYMPAETLWVFPEPEETEKSASQFEDKIAKNFEMSLEDRSFAVEPERMYRDWQDVRSEIDSNGALEFRMLPVVREKEPDRKEIYQYRVADNLQLSHDLRNPPDKDRVLSPLIDWFEDQQSRRHVVVVACGTSAQADRLESLLKPHGIQVHWADTFPNWQRDVKGRDGRVYLCLGKVSSGFVWPEEALAVVTESEIFGARKRRKKRSKAMVNRQLLAFEDLKAGDLVVHDEHGIGQYDGLQKLNMAGATNDFLLIVYRNGDKLYLPVERMNLVQKYMGVEDIIPVLDKMGGVSWEKVKQKAKKSAEKIAGELLKLYAVRKVNKGFRHDPVEGHLDEFEVGFPFEETSDQLKAIDDVLNDMQKPTPMDRLVCGDVGYGKTEVALRASFMSVFNNKQVAILVPTTVLAEQHHATFEERFRQYPVNVACLSRFRKKSEQKVIVEGLKSGKIDIVIGTHRLLQKDIGFKDLGLFVIDEEQRFGVRHKEKLKKLRSTVDVLALTATPIPRTLHMSLVGVRDVSLIATPPEYRQAIITYICEFDEGIAKEAIRKELKRKGQIFFVHNNINSIEKTAGYIKKMVPEIRLDIAHGRMEEKELERAMVKFMNREIDLLVCTTIIESGLDIPSANTIIVNRADRFGLAQIYQLRGRVGRADEQAYAYLFIPEESYLGRDAQKRLKVLMEHSDLGSGFQIAMSDLKIRGGGSILGASQSGHIAAVGYDMFLQLMEESISEMKGERHVPKLDPEINMALSAYIPETYISDIDQRLSTYRRLAKMTETAEISTFKTELIDRFGKLPETAGNLLMKIMLKILARQAGIKRLDMAESHLSLHFSENHQREPQGIIPMIMAEDGRFKLTPEHILKTTLSNSGTYGHLTQTKNILKDIARHVNPKVA